MKLAIVKDQAIVETFAKHGSTLEVHFDNGYVLIVTPQRDLFGRVRGIKELTLRFGSEIHAHIEANYLTQLEITPIYMAELLDIAALDYFLWESRAAKVHPIPKVTRLRSELARIRAEYSRAHALKYGRRVCATTTDMSLQLRFANCPAAA